MTGVRNEGQGGVPDAFGQGFRLARRRDAILLAADHQGRNLDLRKRVAGVGVADRTDRRPGDEFRRLNDFPPGPFKQVRRSGRPEGNVRHDAHAFQVLGQVDELQAMTRRLGQTERTLTIGFVASTLYGALPEALKRFRALRPEIELSLIELSSVEQMTELKGGRIDVGIGRLSLDDPALRQIVLREEVLVAALPIDHSEARRRSPLTLQTFTREPLIVYPSRPRPSFADQVLAALRDRRIVPASIREVRELQVALGLVAGGFGLCIVPANVQRLKRDDVVYRPLAPPPITSPIILNTVASGPNSDCSSSFWTPFTRRTP
jgi:LysR family transcriptional regulator, benzoate and cis,cis-muconate-responsive activator of ben and cat genes